MLTPLKKKRAMADFTTSDKDTGSTPVQVALLTKRISELTTHLKKHLKDNHSRRGLIMLVGKRRKLLIYLEKRNPKAYKSLLKKLDLKK